MMMKIIGAALIVSGGFFLGKVATLQRKNRLEALLEVDELFKRYELGLREYRNSLEEVLSGSGPLANCILEGMPIKGLTTEDQNRLESAVSQFRMGTYNESIAALDSFLKYLNSLIDQLKEENATMGKALPLVTGAIGLLVAVLMF